MIRIQHIKAHLPSKNCQLSFLVRPKPRQPAPLQKTNQVKLTEDYVDIDIACSVQLAELASSKEPVELCVIAVTENDKICVGIADVNLKESLVSVQAQLRGIQEQDGYIVYSYVKQQKIQSARSLEQSLKTIHIKNADKKGSASRGFIKYKNSSSGSSFNENQKSMQSKSGSESPFRKNKIPQHVDVKSDEYHSLLDELYHEILQQQLFNQRVWNRIQANQIFQLRYRSRIQALIGNLYMQKSDTNKSNKQISKNV